jgi:WD40-like Beta Propeller Repeat
MRTFLFAAAAGAALAALSAVATPARSDDEPKAVKPTNLACNTKADEDDPHVGSNNLVLYYSCNAKGKFDIMFSKRSAASAKWGEGKPIEGYVQTAVDDRSVYATAESVYPQFLYYATKTDKETNNFDLYVAVKQGAGRDFSAPTPIDAADTPDDELHPWLTKDGKQLYFSRKTKDGFRVFVTSRKETKGAGGFGKPELVEDLPPDFHHVTLTPDGATMYLQGPLEKGRWGLFVSNKTDKGWSKPEPLEMLNDPSAPTGDRSPCLSHDGATLYFASDRDGGKGGLDLWSVPVADLKKK